MKDRNLIPGEWQTDELGRRFRMIGNYCKEYEMTVHIDGLDIPQSQLDEYNRLKRETTERKKKEESIPPRACPYKHGLSNDCDNKCAWYTPIGCADHTKNPEGKTCPLSGRVCYGEKCGMWRNGCGRT